MNRASSAVFHFWTRVFFGRPVDDLWIAVEAVADETESRSRLGTVDRRPGRHVLYTLQNSSEPHLSAVFPKFPLFRSAYCYYWFYLIFI